jgi:hypothetical protein
MYRPVKHRLQTFAFFFFFFFFYDNFILIGHGCERRWRVGLGAGFAVVILAVCSASKRRRMTESGIFFKDSALDGGESIISVDSGVVEFAVQNGATLNTNGREKAGSGRKPSLSWTISKIHQPSWGSIFWGCSGNILGSTIVRDSSGGIRIRRHVVSTIVTEKLVKRFN